MKPASQEALRLGPRREGGAAATLTRRIPSPTGAARPEARRRRGNRQDPRTAPRTRTLTAPHRVSDPSPSARGVKGAPPGRLTCLGSMASPTHVLGGAGRPPPPGATSPGGSAPRQVPGAGKRARARPREMAPIRFRFRFCGRTSPPSPPESFAGGGAGPEPSVRGGRPPAVCREGGRALLRSARGQRCAPALRKQPEALASASGRHWCPGRPCGGGSGAGGRALQLSPHRGPFTHIASVLETSRKGQRHGPGQFGVHTAPPPRRG